MDVDGDEDDQLGSVASLGISRILASAGVDVSSFSNVFDRQGAASAQRFADVEAEDDDDNKYEDDLSDAEILGAESAAQREEREAHERRQRIEEDRWVRRGEQMQREARQAQLKAQQARPKDVLTDLEKARTVWPDFTQGKRLKMSEVMYETPRDRAEYRASVGDTKRRRIDAANIYHITIMPDTRVQSELLHLQAGLPQLELPDPNRPFYEGPLGRFADPAWIKEARNQLRAQMTRPPQGVDIQANKDARMEVDEGGAFDVAAAWDASLDMVDWEKNILYAPPDESNAQPLKGTPLPVNNMLESGDWIGEIIWDSTLVTPDLIGSEDEDRIVSAEANDGKKKKLKPAIKTSTTKPDGFDPFNLSNDHIYEQKMGYRIRQTFGNIEVFHAGPARSLQMPFYKTTLSKTEARSWHRPALKFPMGVNITFAKLKSKPIASTSARKNRMVTDPSELFKSTKDLTMSEKGPFVLLEFSEEYPPIMSGYGMGTTIVNYYRKKNEQDEFVPKLDFGQPAILNPGDAEPFLLGFVKSGETVPIIHNNLIRAPIFKHQPATTDFLVIRQTINGQSSYYIRPIANVYTVGQTVPNESEIPGPHARKNTTYARIRLQIVAWLLIEKNKLKRLKMSKLLKYFPDQTELQMRQRLKIKGNEFLVYHRSQGPNQGYWQLNSKLPDEKDGRAWPSKREEVVEMATPEQAALYEAMQVGARHLHDAGYSKTAEGKDEDGDHGDDTGMDIEQRLAVWYTTMNYKKAEAQKAWLVVHGDGDPTGRGEGVSFLKTNMKGYFLRKGETEAGRRLDAEAKANGQVVKISNAEQSRIYEEEKRRVWELQNRSLSNPNPPELEAEDEWRMAPTPAGLGPRFSRVGEGRSAAAASGDKRAFSRSNSMAATPIYGESPREFSPAPSMDESVFTGHGGANKILRIKRIVRGKEQVDIVRDPAVIASYRRRVEDRKIEAYKSQVELLQPTGNAEEDSLRMAALQQELENTRKNQARRAARKKYQRRELADEKDIDPSKRKCGACGAVGHTKANRACPMYEENVRRGVVAPTSASAAGTPAQTPGVIGGYAPGSVAQTPMGGLGLGGGFGTDYFSAATGSGEGGAAQTPSTQIKIRLGGGSKT